MASWEDASWGGGVELGVELVGLGWAGVGLERGPRVGARRGFCPVKKVRG